MINFPEFYTHHPLAGGVCIGYQYLLTTTVKIKNQAATIPFKGITARDYVMQMYIHQHGTDMKKVNVSNTQFECYEDLICAKFPFLKIDIENGHIALLVIRPITDIKKYINEYWLKNKRGDAC